MDGQSKEKAPEIIAQFNIVQESSPRERYLDDYHHCPLCGTQLDFTHVTNFVHNTVKEEAFCAPCNIRIKTDDHRLQ